MLVITVQTNHTPNTHTLKMNSRAQHSPYLPKWTRDVRCTQTQSYGNVEKAIKCVVLIFLAKMRYLSSLLTLCILDDDSIERTAEQTFLITFRFAASRLLTIYLSISLSLIYLFFVVAKYILHRMQCIEIQFHMFMFIYTQFESSDLLLFQLLKDFFQTFGWIEIKTSFVEMENRQSGCFHINIIKQNNRWILDNLQRKRIHGFSDSLETFAVVTTALFSIEHVYNLFEHMIAWKFTIRTRIAHKSTQTRTNESIRTHYAY